MKEETFRWFAEAHLVEPGGNKTRQDLAVAENQYPGHLGIGGKDLALLLPLQLGAKHHVGAILQVGQAAEQSVKSRPKDDKEQKVQPRADEVLRFAGGSSLAATELGAVSTSKIDLELSSYYSVSWNRRR